MAMQASLGYKNVIFAPMWKSVERCSAWWIYHFYQQTIVHSQLSCGRTVLHSCYCAMIEHRDTNKQNKTMKRN